MSVEMCVEGGEVWLSGDTYPVRAVLKQHGFRWSRAEQVWYSYLERHTVEELLQLRDEVGARLRVLCPEIHMPTLTPPERKKLEELLKVQGVRYEVGTGRGTPPSSEVR